MPEIRETNLNRLNGKSRHLFRKRRNVYSQFGEDGALEALFELIGTQNKWCVEFGAWDGVHLSNTCHLIRNLGWHAVQIEGSQKKFSELEKNFPDKSWVRQICTMVGFERGIDSLDDVLSQTEIPTDFDFLSIDVDGQDYHIWKSLEDYRPRVIAIEFNPRVPNRVFFVQDRDMAVHHGSSAAAMAELGKEKGYELAGIIGANCIFVLKEEFHKLEIEDNSVDAFRVDVAGSIFCGYDGTIFNTLGKLGWNHSHIYVGQEDLQILDDKNRVYGAKVSDALGAQDDQA